MFGRVEELAEQGLLRFIACTSTLLHGVNLPAKHIIIEKPRKGRSHPMNRSDFLNLAGRAGRLLREFQGYIWCLDPSTWDLPVFDGDRQTTIKSAFSRVIENGGQLIQKAIDETTGKSEKELAHASLGKVFVDYILPGRSLVGPGFGPTDELLRLVEARCEALPRALPHRIYRVNFTIPPPRLDALYSFLRAQDQILDFLPLPPFVKGNRIRLGKIFQAVQQHLERVDNGSHRFHAWLAAEWIHNTPLHKIIASRLDFLGPRARSVGIEIRNLLEGIETELRFRYVRDLRAYLEVLSLVLTEQGFTSEAASLVPLPFFIECGSSTPGAIKLMALGLSRTTALLITDRIYFHETHTPEECLNQLRETPVARLNLPPLCRGELDRFLRK